LATLYNSEPFIQADQEQEKTIIEDLLRTMSEKTIYQVISNLMINQISTKDMLVSDHFNMLKARSFPAT
jgi:flagellar biosynthesis component FlhA